MTSVSRLHRTELVELAGVLASREGYNATGLDGVRILKTEAFLRDVPVLYKPGAVFVLQGSKRGILDGRVFRYDEEHYLAVSIPVAFRMESEATPERPLLAVYVDFDMRLAAEIATEVEKRCPELATGKAQGLVSSRMAPDIQDVVLRLLRVLRHPVETPILGPSVLRELYYRIIVGPQGEAMIAALRQKGPSRKILVSLTRLRGNYSSEISIADLAGHAGMSVPSFHAHFKALTGTSPMQYIKSLRLHEARLMIARQDKAIADVAASVGYVSAAQFSRDFKRHFGRSASEEGRWVRQHLGELSKMP
jgi:AraC-like DNA-binding protein